MMDEALIDEVAHHGVIFNRQKYYLNGTGSGGGGGGGGGNGAPKYETKDEAWQIIAMKMHSDVETCKKRWKYLRERYVSQRKQGDPPVYEHLSRPYLEKMKFLDQHIQPRKSYRNVPNFLTSPHSANNSSGYSEYNMDSKSNGSMKGINHFATQHHYHQHQQPQDQHAMNALSSAAAAASALENVGVANGHVKLEADQVFRDFAAAVASQQLQQISQSQQLQHHHQQLQPQQHNQSAAAVTAAIGDSSQGYQDHFRDNNSNVPGLSSNGCTHPSNSTVTGLPTASSPIKSPLSSPLASKTNEHAAHNGTVQQPTSLNHGPLTNQNYNDANNDDLDSSVSSNFNMKKPRVQLNSHNTGASGNINNSNSIAQHNINNNNHSSSAANSQFTDDTDDDSDENSVNMLTPAQTMTTEPNGSPYISTAVASTSTAAAAAVAAMQRHSSLSNHHHHHQQQPQQQQQQSMFPPNADFLFQLYQQLPHNQAAAAVNQQQHFNNNKFTTPQTPMGTLSTQAIQQQTTQRSSEQLLGELVTTELLKMSKERRKTVQRRILEILFFDD